MADTTYTCPHCGGKNTRAHCRTEAGDPKCDLRSCEDCRCGIWYRNEKQPRHACNNPKTCKQQKEVK